MNVSEQISSIAQKYPNKKSVIASGYKTDKSYTFLELEERINQFSNQLIHLGVKKNDKVLVFIKPNIDFAAIVFSLFKIQAIGVFIDPGMGKKKLLSAIEESKAEVLVGISKVHILRRLFKKPFKNIRLFITNSNTSILATSIYKNLNVQSKEFKHVDLDPESMAAILYTSGGTGKPKGVIYTHKIFIEQTKKLQEMFNLTHLDVDLAGFPLFAMFTLSMGMTSVIPYMNPAKPAKANPKYLLKNIFDHKITFAAGSPAIWVNMIDYCIDKNIALDSIKYFVMFGAPIPYNIHEKFSKVLPYGTTYTPYGATESLPISNISGAQILKMFKDIKGKGICVGSVVPDCEVRVIQINSHNLTKLGAFEIGEIVVQSSTTTKSYYQISNNSKIFEDDGHFWHRMGDTGYFDDTGLLWFTGRLAHSFKIGDKMYFPIPIEQYFLEIEGVQKAAFVKVSAEKTAIIIQGVKSLESKIRDVIAKNNLRVDHILFHSKLPTDIRHNIKIDRGALSLWAKDRV